jgi:hypothetical protein
VVLLAAVSSCRSEHACAYEPTPEGAPGHKRGCSCGEQQRNKGCVGKQRNKECVGLAAARIGDDLTAGREQLPLAGFAYSPA